MSILIETLCWKLSLEPRWPLGGAPNKTIQQLLETGRERYAARLKEFAQSAVDYSDMPPLFLSSENSFPALDSVALTGMIQSIKPRLIIEVGSGFSTKFMRRATNLYSPSTRIVSVDPEPRADIDALCDEMHRKPMEEVDPSLFDRLQAGDVLFIDGSHRCFMGSDVTVVFTEILPRLKPGVFVHFHDVFLPWDYPVAWSTWYFSEQYLLACWLLAGNRLQVELSNTFVEHDADLSALLNPIWSVCGNPHVTGASLWVKIK